MAQRKERITKEETLNFLLTHIVVEKGVAIHLDQLVLFNLTNLARRAADDINSKEGIIPHEIIETLALEFLDTDNQ